MKYELTFLKEYPSLEIALTSVLPVSQTQCRKYLDKRYLLKKVPARTTFELPLNILNYGYIQNSDQKITPIAENDYFLALSKPVGIHSHPHSYEENDNCLAQLRNSRPELLEVNAKSYDRGLLYRLDQDTSGVLVYAKSDEAYQYIRENFNEVVKKKIYKAMVASDCTLLGVLSDHLLPTGPGQKKMKVDAKGKAAQLEILTSEDYQGHKLLTLSLETGLRHQIRVQLASRGFPIVGDSLYGGEVADRLMLHAYEYQIIFDNKPFTFTDLNTF